MNYYVERYEHPTILVRSASTGLAHEFTVGEDGAIFHDEAWFDLGDAKHTAIAYLAHYISVA